jgi:hypothetical protein
LLEWDARTYESLPLPHKQWGLVSLLGCVCGETRRSSTWVAALVATPSTCWRE